MKIVVFGGTGMVGSRVAAELERRGHQVIALGRDDVDVTDPDAVAAAASGADAVVSAVATRGADYTLADVARSLIEGVRRAGVRRLLVVGGFGSLEAGPGVLLLDTPTVPAEYRPEAIQHADALDVYRTVGDLDWTVVSPALYTHPGERTGSYRLGGDRLLVDGNGNNEISAEDFAIAVADLIEQGGHERERVSAAW